MIQQNIKSSDSGLPCNSVLPITEINDFEQKLITFDKNKIHALIFTSVYCVRCIDFLPYIKEMYDKHDLEFILFSDGDLEEIKEMKDYFNWTFPIVKMDEKISNIFNISFLPFVMFIDESMRIINKGVIYNDSDFKTILNLE